MTVTDEQIKERLAGLLAESDLQVTTGEAERANGAPACASWC